MYVCKAKSDICQFFLFFVHLSLREGSKKKIRKNSGLLPNPPRTPPRGDLVFFGHFSGEIFFFIILMENGSIMPETDFKGTVHQKIFFRSNLIFLIVMRCGTADLGHRGL